MSLKLRSKARILIVLEILILATLLFCMVWLWNVLIGLYLVIFIISIVIGGAILILSAFIFKSSEKEPED